MAICVIAVCAPRAMPVLFAGIERDDVAGLDLLDRPAPSLREAGAGCDIERLAKRMRVPEGACARLEADQGGPEPGRRFLLDDRCLQHAAGEIFVRSDNGRHAAAGNNLHGTDPQADGAAIIDPVAPIMEAGGTLVRYRLLRNRLLDTVQQAARTDNCGSATPAAARTGRLACDGPHRRRPVRCAKTSSLRPEPRSHRSRLSRQPAPPPGSTRWRCPIRSRR